MHSLLLAEDNRLNQLVAVGALKRLNCAVEVVTTGASAIEAWSRGDFDAVLLDVMMPDVDGYEAAARIRTAESAGNVRRTPIIGLSARALESDRQAAIGAGMDDYLVKPLRKDDLEVALDRWIVPADRDQPVVPERTGTPSALVDIDRDACRITLRGSFDEAAVMDARSRAGRFVRARHTAAWTVDCSEASDARGCIQVLRSVRGALAGGGSMTVVGADAELSALAASRFP